MPDSGGPHFLINVQCPSCGSALQFHQTAAGRPRKCAKCKATFRVAGDRGEASEKSSAETVEAPPGETESAG